MPAINVAHTWPLGLTVGSIGGDALAWLLATRPRFAPGPVSPTTGGFPPKNRASDDARWPVFPLRSLPHLGCPDPTRFQTTGLRMERSDAAQSLGIIWCPVYVVALPCQPDRPLNSLLFDIVIGLDAYSGISGAWQGRGDPTATD